MINLHYLANQPEQGQLTSWIFSLILAIIAILCIVGIVVLAWRPGPSVREFYEKKSLMGSYWGVRPINNDMYMKAMEMELGEVSPNHARGKKYRGAAEEDPTFNFDSMKPFVLNKGADEENQLNSALGYAPLQKPQPTTARNNFMESQSEMQSIDLSEEEAKHGVNLRDHAQLDDYDLVEKNNDSERSLQQISNKSFKSIKPASVDSKRLRRPDGLSKQKSGPKMNRQDEGRDEDASSEQRSSILFEENA